jgi:hypothetical protein
MLLDSPRQMFSLLAMSLFESPYTEVKDLRSRSVRNEPGRR